MPSLGLACSRERGGKKRKQSGAERSVVVVFFLSVELRSHNERTEMAEMAADGGGREAHEIICVASPSLLGLSAAHCCSSTLIAAICLYFPSFPLFRVLLFLPRAQLISLK